jgi:hypothetical protein
MNIAKLGLTAVGDNPAKELDVRPTESRMTVVANPSGLLTRAWMWFRANHGIRSTAKRLKVTSTVSLGDKRFVALIQVDGVEFLVGGGATNVALLAQIDAKRNFDQQLKESIEDKKRKALKKARLKRRGEFPRELSEREETYRPVGSSLRGGGEVNFCAEMAAERPARIRA